MSSFTLWVVVGVAANGCTGLQASPGLRHTHTPSPKPTAEAPFPAQPTIIEAQEFRVVDTEGRVRGALRVDQAGASTLMLYDKKGRVRAMLRVPEDGPATLLFLDEHGTAQTPRHSLP